MKIQKGTILRTAALVIAIINQIFAVLANTFVTEQLWYQIATLVVTIVTVLLNWWQNNDFTPAARLATEVLNAMEDGKLTQDEIKEIVEKANKKEQI